MSDADQRRKEAMIAETISSLEAEIQDLREENAALKRANNERGKRLAEAEDLLRRGVKTLDREGWEPGETDDEWRLAARKWYGSEELERKMLIATQEKPTR